MHSFLTTLAYGFAALLSVAVLVALWEHLRDKSRKPGLPAADGGPQRAVHIDVDLATLDASDTAPPAGDQQHRQATVTTAMNRMARPPAAGKASTGSWTETRPMVAPGTASESERH